MRRYYNRRAYAGRGGGRKLTNRGKLRGCGRRRWAMFLVHLPLHVTPPAPAPGIISIIMVPFLQKDVSPEVPRAAPKPRASHSFWVLVAL